MKSEPEIIDVEEYAKHDREPPKTAARFRIRIDKEQFVVDVPRMTGRQLLELAGKKPPERYTISEKIKGSKPVKIGLDEYADFTIAPPPVATTTSTDCMSSCVFCTEPFLIV